MAVRARHWRLILAAALGISMLVSAALPAAAQAKRKRRSPSSSRQGATSRKSSTDAAAAASPGALREKIAQLVIVPIYGGNPNADSDEYRKYAKLVRDVRVGGLIILNRYEYGNVRNAEPYATAAFLNQMQRLAKTPLLVAGDFERGASMRMTTATRFPHAMAYGAAGDTRATFALGAAVAREARAMGVHWVLGPDADVHNNPDNPVIGLRSFGEKASAVAAHVQAFIEGAQSDPKYKVMLAAKHFPGHGDTATDTHAGAGILGGDRTRLDQVELAPFRTAIRNGVDAILTAHLRVPSVEPEELPATVSSAVLTGLLRKQMGFEGLIVTDALDMKAIADAYPNGESAVRALVAGADIILMPPDPEAAIDAVVRAVKQGRLTVKRIDESVAKVAAAKAKLGLGLKREVDLDKLNTVLASPAMEADARKVAQRALTLVRNERGMFPVTPQGACAFVLTDNRRNLLGMRFADEFRARAPGAVVRHLDAEMTEGAFRDAFEPVPQCKTVYVAWFPQRSEVAEAFVEHLTTGPAPVALISFADPYRIRRFPNLAAYVAAFSSVPASEVAAAQAMFGEVPFAGKMPVTIPGYAVAGDGLTLEKAK
jgi:beta-N-acetylhexosaminidase